MTLLAEKYHLIIRYLAAQLLYTNMQCPGMVQLMETTKSVNGLEVKGSIIINVCHYKTVTARGPAKVVVVTDQLIISLLDDNYKQERKRAKCLFTRTFFAFKWQ